MKYRKIYMKLNTKMSPVIGDTREWIYIGCCDSKRMMKLFKKQRNMKMYRIVTVDEDRIHPETLPLYRMTYGKHIDRFECPLNNFVMTLFEYDLR